MTTSPTSRDVSVPAISVRVRRGDEDVLDDVFTDGPEVVAAVSEHAQSATDVTIHVSVDACPAEELAALLRAVADLVGRSEVAAALRLQLDPGGRAPGSERTPPPAVLRELSRPGG